MTFIKLTQQDCYFSSFEREIKELDPQPIWVNTSKITFFGNGYIYLLQERVNVKETPEEILQMIKEAENGKGA